jgi:molybdopterin converting factor small subunit
MENETKDGGVAGGEKENKLKIMLTVSLGRITEPLQKFKIPMGTKLGVFANGKFEMNHTVRVNGEQQTADYVLREGDIIVLVGDVSGGW